MQDTYKRRTSEKGSAGTKFLVVFTALVLAAHAGYQYIPVAYEAESVRTEMQTAVVQGIAMPGRMNPVDNVKTRIQKSITANNVPANAIVTVTQKGNSIQAHVVYSKIVPLMPFGLYNYNYVFDHTATPAGFLIDQAK